MITEIRTERNKDVVTLGVRDKQEGERVVRVLWKLRKASPLNQAHEPGPISFVLSLSHMEIPSSITTGFSEQAF